jgi:hypothetical protein
MAEQMTHSEFSKRGGSSKSAAKTAAVRRNVQLARDVLRASRDAKTVRKSLALIDFCRNLISAYYKVKKRLL